MYVSSEDSRVRPSHAALHRIVAPMDSPFWVHHTGPWAPMCRCDKIALMAEDVEEYRQEDAKLPALQRRVLDGSILSKLENDGIISGVSAMDAKGRQIWLRGPDEHGRHGTPTTIPVPPLNMQWDARTFSVPAASILGRYDDHVAAEWEKWARATPVDGKGTSLWDALHGGHVDKTPPPGWPGAGVPQTYASGVRENIRNAKFTRRQTLGTGINGGEKLGNGVTVVFKAREDEAGLNQGAQSRANIQPGTLYKREKAASILDEELGLNLVPPTEVIRDGKRIGSAQHFVAGFEEVASVPANELAAALRNVPRRVREDFQLLDDLMLNSDRHGFNWMIRRRRGATDIALIDNGLCFPNDHTQVFGDKKRFNAAGLDGEKIDAVNRQRLKDLLARESDVRARLKDWLEPDALDLLFDRARRLDSTGIYGDSMYFYTGIPWP